jgi:hypothetical protein
MTSSPPDHRPSVMVVVDASGRILLWEGDGQLITGRSREEMIGQSLDAIVPPEYRIGTGPDSRQPCCLGRPEPKGCQPVSPSSAVTAPSNDSQAGSRSSEMRSARPSERPRSSSSRVLMIPDCSNSRVKASVLWRRLGGRRRTARRSATTRQSQVHLDLAAIIRRSGRLYGRTQARFSHAKLLTGPAMIGERFLVCQPRPTRLEYDSSGSSLNAVIEPASRTFASR